MAYRMDERLGMIVGDYIAEDGAPGIQMISMEVLASRMALLDLDDPGAALTAMAAEITTDGEPYSRVVDALGVVPPVETTPEAPVMQMMAMRSFTARTSVVLEEPAAEDLATDDPVIAARAGAFAMLDITAGPEPAADAEFKEFIRSGFGDDLQRLKAQLLNSYTPTP